MAVGTRGHNKFLTSDSAVSETAAALGFMKGPLDLLPRFLTIELSVNYTTAFPSVPATLR